MMELLLLKERYLAKNKKRYYKCKEIAGGINMIKVALIGIGGIGKVHFDTYKEIIDAEIVAVCDIRGEMARDKVGFDNIKIYTSFDELIENEKVDMLDICTPSYMHADMVVKALEKGIHVLCEKPMSISTNDTRKIVAAIEKSGKLFMTAHVVRFMTPYIYLKNIIDSGELGKPVRIEMSRMSEIPQWSWNDWMHDITKSGGSLTDLSIHDLDFIQYVFGEAEKITGAYREFRNNNDHITTVLCYEGFSVTLTSGFFSAKYPFKAEYTALFEDGYVEFRNSVVCKNGEEVVLEKGWVSESTGINLSGADGYLGEIQYFIDCIINGKMPEIVTPESSQKTIKLLERIRENVINI